MFGARYLAVDVNGQLICPTPGNPTFPADGRQYRLFRERTL